MTPELKQNPITPETCFVPKTHEGKGRRTAVKPGATAARYLHYGRITINAGDAAEKFSNNDHETGLICLRGSASGSPCLPPTLRTGIYICLMNGLRIRTLCLKRSSTIKYSPN